MLVSRTDLLCHSWHVFAGFETDVALLFRVEQNTDAPAFAVQPPDRCGQRQLYDLRVVLAGA